MLIFITAGVYASYVSVAVVIFLLYSIRKIIMKGDKNFVRQVLMVCTVFVAMLSVWIISMKIAELYDSEVQTRVESVAELNIEAGRLIDLVGDVTGEVFSFFSPTSKISFFQGMPLVYYSFWVLFICSVLGIIYLLIYRLRQEKSIYVDNHKMLANGCIEIIILLIDICCLPIAMNMLSLVTVCHYLMKFAFIVPWIMAILVVDMICEIHRERKKRVIQWYKLAIVLASTITICEGVKLANISYTKQYTNYETGIQYVNRVVSRIESIEGYEVGKTKVLFLGFGMNVYSDEGTGYDILNDLTGISGSGSSAVTYSIPMIGYINQRLGVEMNIINDSEDYYFSIEGCISILQNSNVYFDIEEMCNLGTFPNSDCYIWADDILIFKLGKTEYDIESNDTVVMECWPEQGDYEIAETTNYYLDIPLGVSRIVMDVTNGENISFDVLDSSYVQNVKITKRETNQIYIDILSSQDTRITFRVGLVSLGELTTIHKIAIRPITSFYELP